MIATALHPDAKIVLEVLAAHRLCTAEQLHELALPAKSLRWVQTILTSHLLGRQLADRVKVHGADRTLRWYATPAGVEAAVPNPGPGRRYQMTREKAVASAADHTLAVNDVGRVLLRAARLRGDDFGPLGWEHEVALLTGMKRPAHLVADAAVSYVALHRGGLVHVNRWLEVERCNQSSDKVAAKVRHYVAALRHGEWRSRFSQLPEFPPVLFVFCDGGQVKPDTRLLSVMELLDADDDLAASGLRVQLTTLPALDRHGPFAPVVFSPRSAAARPLVDLAVGDE